MFPILIVRDRKNKYKYSGPPSDESCISWTEGIFLLFAKFWLKTGWIERNWTGRGRTSQAPYTFDPPMPHQWFTMPAWLPNIPLALLFSVTPVFSFCFTRTINYVTRLCLVIVTQLLPKFILKSLPMSPHYET